MTETPAMRAARRLKGRVDSLENYAAIIEEETGCAELLAACKAAMDGFEDVKPGCVPVVDILRAAIARAERQEEQKA